MGRVTSTLPARTTIPVLAHVEVIAKDGAISIRSSSLDMEAATSIPADVSQHGTVMLHGLTLAAIAGKLPKSGTVSIAVVDGVAKLTCGRSSYDLATLPADDFPQPLRPDASKAHTITIDAGDLTDIITATIASTGTDAGRIYLHGIRVATPKAGTILAVATDGHELVKTSAPCAGSIEPITIPTQAAKLLKDIASSGSVTISTDGSRLVATADTGDTIATALIDGKYPDYERVIPRPNGAFASVVADQLSSATDRAMTVFTGANVLGSRIALSATSDGISIAANGPYNRALEVVDADCEKHDLACDGTKLRGLLSHWGEKSISLQQASSGDPILIRCDDEPQTIQVLMPMR